MPKALDKPLTRRQIRILRAKAQQYERVRAIMQAEHTPHKTITGYVRDISNCYYDAMRELSDVCHSMNLVDQLRRDDDHEDMTLDDYISTLFCKIKSIDSVVEQGRKAYDLERENAALRAEIATLRIEVGNPSDLQRAMEEKRPLRERYEDALEVVHKQSLRIEELEALQSDRV